MKKTRKQNLILIEEASIKDVQQLILNWIASGEDINIKGELKGWILFGGSLLRFDVGSKKLLLAFRKRENHPQQMIDFTVNKIEAFVLKNFSGSCREFADQGYKYGIQKGYENYLFYEWSLPRCFSEIETVGVVSENVKRKAIKNEELIN